MELAAAGARAVTYSSEPWTEVSIVVSSRDCYFGASR
jgi:hypothetical protein